MARKHKRFHFCGRSEKFTLQGDTRMRKTKDVRWSVDGTVPGIIYDVMEQTCKWVFDSIQSVCGMTFKQVRTGSQVEYKISCEEIHEPGVLGYAYLPGPKVQPMVIDLNQNWAVNPGAKTPRKINLATVVLHEGGHLVGMTHDDRPPRGQDAIMEPAINENVNVLQLRDIERLQTLYGQPVKPVDPGKPPEELPEGSLIVIRITNADRIEIPGYVVTKI